MRGGVPVLRRSTANGRSRSFAQSVVAGGSPMRPPAYCVWPTWILPARKVPAGSTTAGAPNRRPELVSAPESDEHTTELQSLMRISYAVVSLKNKKTTTAHDDR